MWAYGIQLWSSAKKSNINKIQRFQCITLQMITKAFFYISNHTLHTDLNIQTVLEVAKSSYKLFCSHLANH